ncbi:preprotein translocase subunit YajC [Marinilabilia salmonicolor]|jgi:preprotein translocase subunit YajC|uniref:Sec translocon accessory complex subunit YajC n=1 Tax=Marinilabilia salmonicolor TaxID=989 RepID=A0A2T0WTM3_9BACT|nr:preprotein translocase subunit YajC [Marinilabilia salmonicolor]PRY90017.1 protein translocase subunit yajC [Marinilabilia salmonicolor]RCW28822.1 protein translocase subunit yajC [Marinilabilia salmonicolor]
MMSLFLQAAGEGSQGGMLMQLLPFLLIIVVFYFFMIRPQVKRQKELRKYRESLKKGDKVVTTGGIYGKVTEVKESHVVIEIANDVNIKVDKAGIIMDMSDAAKK